MNILILNPSSQQVKNVNRDYYSGAWCHGQRIGGTQFPPLNLLYVATILKDLTDVNLTFCDAQADPFSFKEALSKNDFHILIFSTSFMTIDSDLNNVRLLKQNNIYLKTVVFGAYPTFLPDQTLQHKEIDIIIRFEPEIIIKELIAAMTKKEDWQNIKGIGYKQNDEIKINPPHEVVGNLDSLPFPDRSFLSPQADYFIPIIKRTPSATVLTSRGCTFNCSFCTAPAFENNKARARSAKNVFDELLYLKNLGIKEVYFRDENFTFFRERNRALYNEIIERDIDLSWVCNAHVNTLTEKDIQLMKKSGCHYVKVGIESASPRILKIIKKNLNLDYVHEIFNILRKEGINVHASFMIGLPEETIDDYEATLKLAKLLNPTTVTFAICTPYPGTELFEKVKDDFLKINSLSPFQLKDIHIKGLLNDKFSRLEKGQLENYVRKAYFSFYMRPAYLFWFLKNIGNLNDLKRFLRAGLKVIKFALNIN